jgi:LAS superfamily LD-carboxypeptidase LdcB
VCTGPPIAYPGTSNHGWGRAIDFKDRRNVLTCYDEEFLWLKNNAHRFGWVHPPWAHCGMETQEPWHWEYAGVTDPTLVQFVTIDPALMATAE